MPTSPPESYRPTPRPPELRLATAGEATSCRWVDPLRAEIGRVLIGQTELVDALLVALLGNGHVLLEGLPGLAKTLALNTLARAARGVFSRIQFTADMQPSDVVGSVIYDLRAGGGETNPGPVFANFVLADAIDRAPAKVQSALLAAMQAGQVTLGSTTHPLPRPFLVMATQSPRDQAGRHRLTEAQLDRFMFKLRVGYPSVEEERCVLARMAATTPCLSVEQIVTLAQIDAARADVDQVYVDERIRDYIVALIDATRHPKRYGLELAPLIRRGASPRGSIALALASKARAYLRGREYVVPHDVKVLAANVLRHRIAITDEAEAQRMDADHIIDVLLDQLPIP